MYQLKSRKMHCSYIEFVKNMLRSLFGTWAS